MKIDSDILLSQNLPIILDIIKDIPFLNEQECELLIYYLNKKIKSIKLGEKRSLHIGETTNIGGENNVSNIKNIELDEDPSNTTGVKVTY